ncbi:LytR C-terminal domain-containing protein [Ilumatobacter sp.]|uniref:LytR C-terminal domain-containing protein n=1 Tax=Ilumatobacter sp. TaxID=1967498 RepID=UPI003C3D5351
MTNEDSTLGTTRRTPRQGMGGSPVGSWLTIALAVIAVVIGFLILNNITDDGDASGTETSAEPADDETVGTGTGPVISVDVPTTEAPTTSTTVPRVTTGASVIVANANTVGGSAGNMTKTLELAGYTVVDPVDASGPNITESIVYYDEAQAGAQDVANSVARDLGGVEVLVLPSPAPTASGDIGDAGVLVLLGDDQAGKTLEELSGSSGEATTEAPDPAADVPATAPADSTATTEAG